MNTKKVERQIASPISSPVAHTGYTCVSDLITSSDYVTPKTVPNKSVAMCSDELKRLYAPQPRPQLPLELSTPFTSVCVEH